MTREKRTAVPECSILVRYQTKTQILVALYKEGNNMGFPQFVEKHLNEMKLGTVFSVLLVLFLGLALSEGRRFEGRKRGNKLYL